MLEEILEEQKLACETRKEFSHVLEQLSQQVKAFDNKLQSIRLNVSAINTSSLEQLVNVHLQSVNLSLDLHLKKVEERQKKKELKERVLYWLPWLIVLILCGILFRIAIGGQFHGSLF